MIVQQSHFWRYEHKIRPKTATCQEIRGQGTPFTFALMARSDGNQKLACVYCGQLHSSVQCNIVTNAQKRKEILKNSGQCFICIRRNHLSRNCHSWSHCSKCYGRHHLSICNPTRQQIAQPALKTKIVKMQQMRKGWHYLWICVWVQGTLYFYRWQLSTIQETANRKWPLETY